MPLLSSLLHHIWSRLMLSVLYITGGKALSSRQLLGSLCQLHLRLSSLHTVTGSLWRWQSLLSNRKKLS